MLLKLELLCATACKMRESSESSIIERSGRLWDSWSSHLPECPTESVKLLRSREVKGANGDMMMVRGTTVMMNRLCVGHACKQPDLRLGSPEP